MSGGGLDSVATRMIGDDSRAVVSRVDSLERVAIPRRLPARSSMVRGSIELCGERTVYDGEMREQL